MSRPLLIQSTSRIDYNDPIMLEAKLGHLDFPYIENVHNYGSNSSLRFIIENTGEQPHPMHMHGTKHMAKAYDVSMC